MGIKKDRKAKDKKKRPYQRPEITSEEVFEKLVVGCGCKTPDGISSS